MLFGYGPPEQGPHEFGTGPVKMVTGTPRTGQRPPMSSGYRTPEHEPMNLSAGAVEMDTGTAGTGQPRPMFWESCDADRDAAVNPGLGWRNGPALVEERGGLIPFDGLPRRTGQLRSLHRHHTRVGTASMVDAHDGAV
jgi:hypothetical protein